MRDSEYFLMITMAVNLLYLNFKIHFSKDKKPQPTMSDNIVEQAMKEARENASFYANTPMYIFNQDRLLAAFEKIKQDFEKELELFPGAYDHAKLEGKIELLNQLISSLK